MLIELRRTDLVCFNALFGSPRKLAKMECRLVASTVDTNPLREQAVKQASSFMILLYRQFLPPGPRLETQCHPRRQSVLDSIEDTGPIHLSPKVRGVKLKNASEDGSLELLGWRKKRDETVIVRLTGGNGSQGHRLVVLLIVNRREPAISVEQGCGMLQDLVRKTGPQETLSGVGEFRDTVVRPPAVVRRVDHVLAAEHWN